MSCPFPGYSRVAFAVELFPYVFFPDNRSRTIFILRRGVEGCNGKVRRDEYVQKSKVAHVAEGSLRGWMVVGTYRMLLRYL